MNTMMSSIKLSYCVFYDKRKSVGEFLKKLAVKSLYERQMSDNNEKNEIEKLGVFVIQTLDAEFDASQYSKMQLLSLLRTACRLEATTSEGYFQDIVELLEMLLNRFDVKREMAVGAPEVDDVPYCLVNGHSVTRLMYEAMVFYVAEHPRWLEPGYVPVNSTVYWEKCIQGLFGLMRVGSIGEELAYATCATLQGFLRACTDGGVQGENGQVDYDYDVKIYMGLIVRVDDYDVLKSSEPIIAQMIDTGFVNINDVELLIKCVHILEAAGLEPHVVKDKMTFLCTLSRDFFQREMFTVKSETGGYVANVVKACLPKDLSVEFEVGTETKSFVNDNIRKLTNLFSEGLTTPLVQGEHKVGFDLGAFKIGSLTDGSIGTMILPTMLIIGGAAAVYYLVKDPMKNGWLKNTIGAISTLMALANIHAFGVEIFNKLCDSITMVAEAELDDNMSDTGTVIREMGVTQLIELVGTPILTWMHFNTTGRKPSDSMVKDFVDLSKMSKNIDDGLRFSMEKLTKIVHYVITYIGDWLEKPEWSEAFHPFPRLAKIDNAMRVLSREIYLQNRIPTKDTARDVIKAEDEIAEIVHTLKPGSGEYMALKALEVVIFRLKKSHEHVYNKVDVRARPYDITLLGKPGQGKSVLAQLLAMDILPRLLSGRDLIDHAANPEANVYYLNTMANFWDNFKYQKCIVIDDVCIVKDLKTGEVDLGLMEGMRVNNDAPYYPDQASMEHKGRFGLGNVLTIQNMNSLTLNAISHSSMTDTEAQRRRMNAWLVTVKIVYCKKDDRDFLRRRMDKTKVRELRDAEHDTELETGIWEFIPWDLLLGKRDTSRPILGYDDFVERCVREAREQRQFTDLYKVTREGRKNRAITKRLMELGLESVDELLDPAVAAAAEVRDKALGEVVRESGDNPDSHMFAVKRHVEERWGGIDYVFNDLYGKVKNFRGVELYSEVDKAMKPYLMKTYESIVSTFETIRDAVKKHPYITALSIGAVLLTGMVMFMPAETPIGRHSGETKKEKTNKKPTKRMRMKTRSLKAVKGLPLGIAVPEMGHGHNIINKILGNYFRYDITLDREPICSAWAIAVAGTTIVLPLHYLEDTAKKEKEFPDRKVEIAITSIKDGSEPMYFSLDVFKEFCVDLEENELSEDGPQEDIVFADLCNLMPRVKDIRSHLMSQDDIMHLGTRGTGTFVRLRKTTLGREVEKSEAPCYRGALPVYDEYNIQVSQTMFYEAESAPGDCGSPFFMTFGSDVKLVSFHVAGTREKGIKAKGMGHIISRQMVSKYVYTPSSPGLAIPSILKPVKVDYVFDSELGGTKEFSIKQGFASSKTQLVKGPLFNVGPEELKVPARLGSYIKDGEVIDPMIGARERYSRPSKIIGPRILKSVSGALLSHKISVGGTAERVLSIYEACFGNERMAGITKGTSAGLPEKKIMPYNYKGKTWFLGENGENENAPGYLTLVELVEDALRRIKAGEPMTFLFEDSLKDEPVSKAKFESGATRLFSASGLTLQVIMRMYYGDAIDVLTAPKAIFHNFHAVGMNPYTDWPAAVNVFAEVGLDHMIDADHKTFDAAETAEILFEGFSVLDGFYPKATGEDMLVRRMIAEAIVFSFHVNKDGIFQWIGSNPSGNGLTIFLNDMSNQMLLLIVLLYWYLKKHDLTLAEADLDTVDWEEIFTQFRLLTMGDDVLIGLGKMFADMTTKDFADCLGDYGYELTNSNKSNPTEFPMAPRHITDTTFTKRGFKRLHGLWVGPLEIGSIFKSLHWEHAGLKEKQRQEIIQTALYELALHGKEVWTKYATEILEASASKPVCYLPLDRTYEACFKVANTLMGYHN